LQVSLPLFSSKTEIDSISSYNVYVKTEINIAS